MNARLLATALMLAGATSACTEAELAAADRYAALLAGGPGQDAPPPSSPAPVAPVVAAPAAPPAIAAAPPIALEPEPCVSVFRVQTCENGVLHHLGAQMEWVD